MERLGAVVAMKSQDNAGNPKRTQARSRQGKLAPVRRRGLPGQRAKRTVERLVRKRAVACTRLLERAGVPARKVAMGLGVAERTLRRWCGDWDEDHLTLCPLGRRPCHASRGERSDILAILGECGAGVGVPTLQEIFPSVARGELEELTKRYRRAWQCRHHLLSYRLNWRRAGIAWAADFSHPPLKIDGIYKRILLVRDMGSKQVLLALPSLGEDGDLFRQTLKSLCKWYGVPLVVKLDNGSAFRDEKTKALAAKLGILLLYSPPYTPQYNGAVEAGIGSIKTRAQHASVAAGRPGEWICDDIENAACEANATARPFGQYGPPPEEVWRQRVPVGEEERKQFQQTYRRRYAEECSLRGLPWTTAIEPMEKASIDRVAISRALIEHGYLGLRRKRITAPISRKKAANKR